MNCLKRIVVLVFTIIYFVKPGFTDGYAIKYDRLLYDDKKESTYTTEIIKIQEMNWTLNTGITAGIYLTVKYLKKELFVPVAPTWYLQNKRQLEQGLSVRITGVIQKVEGRDIILPKLITLENYNIFIRNYDGKTMWDVSYNSKTENHSQHKKENHSGHGGHTGH